MEITDHGRAAQTRVGRRVVGERHHPRRALRVAQLRIRRRIAAAHTSTDACRPPPSCRFCLHIRPPAVETRPSRSRPRRSFITFRRLHHRHNEALPQPPRRRRRRLPGALPLGARAHGARGDEVPGARIDGRQNAADVLIVARSVGRRRDPRRLRGLRAHRRLRRASAASANATPRAPRPSARARVSSLQLVLISARRPRRQPGLTSARRRRATSSPARPSSRATAPRATPAATTSSPRRRRSARRRSTRTSRAAARSRRS